MCEILNKTKMHDIQPLYDKIEIKNIS